MGNKVKKQNKKENNTNKERVEEIKESYKMGIKYYKEIEDTHK